MEPIRSIARGKPEGKRAPGADPDVTGAAAYGLLYEHPGKRQPDQDRSGGAGVHRRGGITQPGLFLVHEPEGRQEETAIRQERTAGGQCALA